MKMLPNFANAKPYLAAVPIPIAIGATSRFPSSRQFVPGWIGS